MAQTTTDIPTCDDPQEMAKRRTRLVTETIAFFDAHTSDDRAPTTCYDLHVFAGAINMFDVATKPARESRSIRPGVVHMVNDTDISVVSRTGSNATGVAPRCVMMDSGTHPVIIGRRLA